MLKDGPKIDLIFLFDFRIVLILAGMTIRLISWTQHCKLEQGEGEVFLL